MSSGVTQRPMRSPHHTASKEALVGRGSGVAAPGEITRAHRGVLFLDEIAEFAEKTLNRRFRQKSQLNVG